jgi:hypothetical protein
MTMLPTVDVDSVLPGDVLRWRRFGGYYSPDDVFLVISVRPINGCGAGSDVCVLDKYFHVVRWTVTFRYRPISSDIVVMRF